MLKIFRHIRSVFYLVIAIIIAVFGLSHSIYGLIVHFRNPYLYEINIKDINEHNLSQNRYIEIVEAKAATEPVIYVDERNNPTTYIYALISEAIAKNKVSTSSVIVESNMEIKNWNTTEIKGLLEPYWESVDEEIIYQLEYYGVNISDDVVYMKLNNAPWKWYWHLLIIGIVLLFFYRMLEAAIKQVKTLDQ